MKKFILVIPMFMATIFLVSYFAGATAENNKFDEILIDETGTQTQMFSNGTEVSIITNEENGQDSATNFFSEFEPSATTTTIFDVTEHSNITDVSITTYDTLDKYRNILAELNAYQEQFFDICQILEHGEGINYHEIYSEYYKCFTDIELKVLNNNVYYNRYIKIEPDINKANYTDDDPYPNPTWIFIQQYEKYDELLNDLYLYIKSQIPIESFEDLMESEIQWIRDKEVFIKSVHGAEEDRYALSYKAEITKFRCLLLMLYL